MSMNMHYSLGCSNKSPFVSRCDPYGRPEDTGGAAHSCAAGHTTYDKALSLVPPTNINNNAIYRRKTNVHYKSETNVGGG